MRYLCPVCQRPFDEAGFCPFDRAQLLAPASPEQKTVESEIAIPIASAHATDIEPRRGTFPLTPAPSPAAARTQDITAPRVRPVQPTPAEAPVVRALSASEDPQQALEAYQTKRESEYDRLVGQTLDGRYFVEAKIGEGGMGVVFSARHAVIERPLAIKVLKREVMRDTATIRRFVQEAKAASRIGHPNIVDVTDFGTTPDGMTYSVMEYVSGRTLGATLREAAPFPAVRTIRIAAQIARALGAAHDKGIVHRDLKPENVFLIDRDGRTDFVKIVDFGIAKVLPMPGSNPNEPRLTRAGSVFGTPEYMAPEQAAGRSDTDGRVDVYALGVILYEMTTGRVPHRGDSMVRTLAMQMLDPVEPPSRVRPDLGISPELEAVIMKALAKKRDHRYQTMGELLAALDKLQTVVGASVTGSPVYALQPLPPGADPTVIASPGRPLAPPFAGPIAAAESSVPVPIPRVSQPAEAAVPRAHSPSSGGRRLKDEPEFVTREKPVTFEHVFTGELAAPHRRRWPILILFAAMLGAAGGAIALVVKSRNRQVASDTRDAGTFADAQQLAVTDAATAEDAPLLAAEDAALPMDASIRVAVQPRDARTRPPVLPTTPNGRGTIGIQVLTKPEGATLYVGTSYRGPGGTQLEEPLGTRLEVTCKHAGYKAGVVQLVFDGTREAELCVLQRIKICAPGLKNPFDDCEPDPNGPIPP